MLLEHCLQQTNMQSLFAFLVLVMTLQAPLETRLTVTVENIHERKGVIIVGLFDRESGFLQEATEGKIIRASDEKVTVIFENLKPGKYAVSVIHDRNENTQLDKNFLGIPKEGFGFSNNVIGSFGPPTFEQAHIDLVDQKELCIKLKYF